VKEERRLRIDNQPYGRVLEEMMLLAYRKHPYKNPIIGSMAHLDAAQEEDYKTFYKTYYVPNNATLSIAGDINVEETKKWVQKYFADIPKGQPVPRPMVKEEPQNEEIRGVAYDNIQLPAVVHAFKTPSPKSPDFYAVNMLMSVLSGGESSRLSKSLKDEQQKALFVGAFAFDLEDDPSIAISYGILNQGVEIADLEKAMNAEYEKLQKELISEKEFEKIRNQIQKDFVTKNDKVVQIAENLANYHVYYGSANLINTEIDKYMAVTRQDIQRVAKKYLANTNKTTLQYLPKPNN
jgi:predicted Zn-dependent peptidase